MLDRKELHRKFLSLGWGNDLSLGWGNDPQSDNVFDFLAAAAEQTPPGAVVLDLGAGQSRYSFFFEHCHYLAVDFALGDAKWDYSRLDIVGDVCSPGFIRDRSVDFVLNTVTLEHLNEPGNFMVEAARVLKPGGMLFLYAPMVDQEHQVPYDFFRYTSYGLRYLCEKAGLEVVSCHPSNGPLYTASRWLLVTLSATRVESVPLRILRTGMQGLIYVISPICDWFDKYPSDMVLPMLWLLTAKKQGELCVTPAESSKEVVVRQIVQCPECRGSLTETREGYSCVSCKTLFPTTGKQINFLSKRSC
jgi:SAM-dependent methyltransferase